MSYWEKMHKAKQSQDRKRLKLGNVLITKETSCWEWQGFVVCPSFRKARLFFKLSLGFSHSCNCLLRTYSRRLTGKNLIGKVPFQVQKENTFTAQISFILGANRRYINILQNIVRWFTSKLFQNSKFNFCPFFFNLGLFKAKSRPNLPLYCL